MRVAIVGGGVVGLAAAFFLHERGAEVTVLERDRCGDATSLGNAGWITPGVSSVPLSGPGVVPQALKWMLRPDSPFYIRPRPSPTLALWLLRFWRSSTDARFEHGLKALVTLNASALDLLDRYRERGVRFEMHSEGLLIPSVPSRRRKGPCPLRDVGQGRLHGLVRASRGRRREIPGAGSR